MKITDLKCTIMGQNPVIRITTDEGIDGYGEAENPKSYLKPHVLFYVEYFVKDMGLALEELKRMGVVLPGLTLVHQLYRRVMDLGHGRSGTHALILALEDLAQAHVNLPPA